jgi:glycosyltransferase involved in cell wall biosynthesis
MTLRVLFIAAHPVEGPSTRFRISQFLPYLEAHGVSCELRPFFTSEEARAIYLSDRTGRKIRLTLAAALRRLGDVLRAGRFDLVYILREAFPFGPPLIERALGARAGRMVFDFDDSIHLRSSGYDNPLDRLRDFSKPARLVGLAHAVVPGSRWLAERAVEMGCPPERIEVLPTVVDARLFAPRRRPVREEIVVGWIGTPRNTAYLTFLRDVMETVAARHPAARFRFVGAEPFHEGRAPAEFREWSLEGEVAEVQDFDIGIMPLPDDDFTRGKCGFKLIEYMAVGAATVASPVGANLDITVDGATGLFATTPEDWVSALDRLLGDAGLRARMGAAGRARVEAHYSLEVVAPRLLALIRRAADRAAA